MNRRLATLKAIDKFSQHRFRYGTMDCCLFAIKVAKEVTGNDHGTRFHKRYNTRQGARELVAAAGGMAAIVTSQLGEPVDPDQALDGDPVMVAYAAKHFDHVLGVRCGDHIVLKTGKSVKRIDMKHGILGWRA